MHRFRRCSTDHADIMRYIKRNSRRHNTMTDTISGRNSDNKYRKLQQRNKLILRPAKKTRYSLVDDDGNTTAKVAFNSRHIMFCLPFFIVVTAL